MARHLGPFVAGLFGVEAARQAQVDTAGREAAIFAMKTFIARRAVKKYPADKLPADEPAALRAAVAKLCGAHPTLVTAGDEELTVATVLDALLAREKTEPTAVASELRARSSGGRRSTSWSPRRAPPSTAGCRSTSRTRWITTTWSRCDAPIPSSPT